jgi:Mn-dependent DtxR family transcriptional regulator
MELTAAEKQWYVRIHLFVKENGRFPSRGELAKEQRVCKNAVQKMVKKLEEKGMLKCSRGYIYETQHAKLILSK